MKSDLVGKVKCSELKTSTLYLDRRVGIVFLTTDFDGRLGSIVHTSSTKFPLGKLVSARTNVLYEPLGGKITLSNI